jgi:hypothetical protein
MLIVGDMTKIQIFFLYLLTVLFSVIAPLLIALPPIFISFYVCPEETSIGAFLFGILLRLPLFIAYLSLLPCWYSYGKGNRRNQRVPLLIAGIGALPLALYFSLVLLEGTYFA